MVTVYDVKTGEKINLDGVDARDRIKAGMAVRNEADLPQNNVAKRGPKPKNNDRELA